MYTVSERTKTIFDSMVRDEKVQAAMELIRQDEKKTIDELKELVVIEAPTFEESDRASYMKKQFEELGLLNVTVDRGGNVIGIRPGKKAGKKILIEGHLDTVFPRGTVHGVKEEGDYLYAPGIGDDTRALVMMLGLIRALKASGLETEKDIIFTATTREEGIGNLGGMKDFLADHADEIAAVVSIDGNDMRALEYEATCIETWEVVFHGIGGHAFGAFGTMAQPIHAAARAVAKIADLQVPSDPKTTFCVSNFHGGTAAGVHAIAPEASIKFNFRSNSKEELEKLRKKIFDALEAGAKEETERWGKDTITMTKQVLCDIPGGTQDANAPIVEAAYCGLEHLGLEPFFVKGGCTNANIAIDRGIPAICVGRAYTPDEKSQKAMAHSLDEHFHMKKSYLSVQQALMVLLMCAGVSDVSEPLYLL